MSKTTKSIFLCACIAFGVGCGNNDELFRLRAMHRDDSENISALRITVDTIQNEFGRLQDKYDSLYKEAEPVLPYEGQVVEYQGRVMTWGNGEWFLGCTNPGCAVKAVKEANYKNESILRKYKIR